jgi:hypothetical protein
MTWFSLPSVQAENKAAFFDSDSAAVWLAGQPQANAPAMLTELVAQIQAFNCYITAPRDRFKTLEVLRKTLFAVSGECQRRYENKPLPLLPAEQVLLDTALQLWRASAVSYLHCLSACLDGDPSISTYSARVAHRVLSCLRMEQLNCYLAGADLAGDFWHNLHAVLASAEQLGVAREPVEDRLLGETSESTVSGQYCMILLLHLARPFTLSRAQFAAVNRWFARWREQAAVLSGPEESPKSRCIALDLTQDQPLHDNLGAARVGRWLSVKGVLRKMRERVELLAAGESPESLKLGSGLSSEACVELLNTLSEYLKHPKKTTADLPGEASSIGIAAGLETVYRFLGGTRLKEAVAPHSTFASRLSHEQIALFGHVARDTWENSEKLAEQWQLMRLKPGELLLVRPAGSGNFRLVLRSLLAIQLSQKEHCSLASVSSLHVRCDGSLCITASLYPGTPAPLLAELREKPVGKISRHPAFLLSQENGDSSVFLPVGLQARALSIRFYEGREQSNLGLRLLSLVERGGDNERWSIAVDG